MLKRILKTFIILGLIALFTFAAIKFGNSSKEMLCNDVLVTIKDASNGEYVSLKEINKILDNKKLSPKGKVLSEVSISTIENELNKHPLVDKATCYKTPSGKIGIDIYQRIPMLKVYGTKGEQYYIDNKGERMPNGTKSTQPTLVASGNIAQEYAKKELFEFSVALKQHAFWNDQIEQVYVNSKKDVELIPRVGNHIISIGDLNNHEEKLNRLKIFYDKVIKNVGWNKYSKINIEFENQIICTKAK